MAPVTESVNSPASNAGEGTFLKMVSEFGYLKPS
jgi:hypothetical protein